MDYLNSNRKIRTDERIRFTLSKPFECRAIMKKFFQCVDHFEFNEQKDFASAKESCSEFDYQACLKENSKKLFENRIFNVNKVSAGEAEEE